MFRVNHLLPRPCAPSAPLSMHADTLARQIITSSSRWRSTLDLRVDHEWIPGNFSAAGDPATSPHPNLNPFPTPNEFVPDLEPELWGGDEITASITRAGKLLDELDLLPSPFPIEAYLPEADLRHLKQMFNIGGLSYGNVSARKDDLRFWMSASGVDKTKLEEIGPEILMVTDYIPERRAMSLSVPPNVTPRRVSDLVIRLGLGGDRFGLRRGGLTYRRLVEDNPHGVVVADDLAPGQLAKNVTYLDGRIRLTAPELMTEVERLGVADDAGYPLRLIGMREIRSENSWQHNAPMLLRGGRSHAARMHPDDATARGLAEGDLATVQADPRVIEVYLGR